MPAVSISSHPYLSILFLVLLLSGVHSQPPQPNGRGREFLTPGNPSSIASAVCAVVPLRELSGQCTSVRDPDWGRARLAQFSYLRTSSSRRPTGNSLPSARQISNILFDQRANTINSHGLNQLFVFFAQFLDHNFAATPQAEGERFDIPVPPGDTRPGVRSLRFIRSIRGSADGGRSVRPINSLTSAIDLVAVYGPNELRNNELIELDSSGAATGRMKTSAGNLLPLNTGGFVNSPDSSARFFLAGDHRANEHPVLTALHTIFLREHNSLVDLIRKEIPGLPASLIYEYARTLNVAQFQKIVYEEFYPAIIGKPLPPYRNFQANVNPTLSDIFSGAAFRVGHTMVGNEIPRAGSRGRLPSVKMRDTFFRPARTFSSLELDNFIRGTATTSAQEVDTWVVDSLRNSLFTNVRGEEGFDLVALNIQRGRDHALPKFNEIKAIFGLRKARTFQQISSNENIAARLSAAYSGRVDDVEAFPGLLAEDRERGSGLGRTMIALWEAEFRRLRDGDQFFYLRTSKLPDIIRRGLPDWVKKVQARGGITLKSIIVSNSGVKAGQLPSGRIFRVSRTPITKPPMTTVSAPRSPPMLSGICQSEVCCLASCKKCGGQGCSSRPGGEAGCCSGSILASGRECSARTSAPCIIQPSTAERPICSGEVCCPRRCGKCGGVGCELRPGGIPNCCSSSILEAGRKCRGAVTSACIIQAVTNERPICDSRFCCPARCGKCGGDSCDQRPGGEVNCCVERIQTSGRKCGGAITSACII